VTDLDDAHCYSAHVKPHTNPLDFHINAFYFLPSTQHAVSVSQRLQQRQSPVTMTPAISSAQFDDADL